jgi:hypothetical protein
MSTEPNSVNANSWVTPKVRVQVDPGKGKGLYVIEPIAAGEPVCTWDYAAYKKKTKTYSREEIEATPEPVRSVLIRYSWMLGPNEYDSIEDPGDDISFCYNHSCEPTTWFAVNDDSSLIAIRDLKVGDELTYDYATTETENSFHAGMQCLCGSAKCRGVLSGKEHQDPAFVEQYKGRFSTFIQSLLDAHSS